MALNPSVVFYNLQELILGPTGDWIKVASYLGKHINLQGLIHVQSNFGFVITIPGLKCFAAPLHLYPSFPMNLPNLHLSKFQCIYSSYNTNLTLQYTLSWLLPPTFLLTEIASPPTCTLISYSLVANVSFFKFYLFFSPSNMILLLVNFVASLFSLVMTHPKSFWN